MANEEPEDPSGPDIQLEQALARIREGDKIDREADAMVGSTRAQAALQALHADLPLDATGPFVRKVAHLASDRVSPESERAVADVVDIPAQPMAELPRAKVMIQPVGVNPHVTAPSLAKRAALGLAASSIEEVDKPSGGVTAGGRTMRLGVSPGAEAGLSPPAESESPPRRATWSVALWTCVIVLLAGGVPLLVHRVGTTDTPADGSQSAAVSPKAAPETRAVATAEATASPSGVATDRTPPQANVELPNVSAGAATASSHATATSVVRHDRPSASAPTPPPSSPVAPPSATTATKPWLE